MKIKASAADWILEILTWAILAGSSLRLGFLWPSIPDKIPMHYNFAGEIDRWGAKGELLIIAVMPWFICILITVIEQFPQVWNTGITVTEENRFRVYRILKYMLKTMKFLISLVFVYLIYHSVVQVALPEWFTIGYVALIFGDMAFWLVRLFRSR